MNEVILTARAVLGAGYQIIFLEKRINFGRKSKHDLSDKNVFAGAKLSVSVTLLGMPGYLCNSLFLQFLCTSYDYIIYME